MILNLNSLKSNDFKFESAISRSNIYIKKLQTELGTLMLVIR